MQVKDAVTALRKRILTPEEVLEHSQNFPYELVSNVDREHFWFLIRNEIILQTISQHLDAWQTRSFLEIGSGCATVVGYLNENGMKRVAGCDKNPLAIQLSEQRFPQIKFYESDFESLRTTEGLWDSVGMFDFIEHLEDDLSAVSKVRPLLRRGGKVFITVPAHQSLYSHTDKLMGHYRRYSVEQLTEVLLKAGFVNPCVKYTMKAMVPMIWLKRMLIKPEVPTAPQDIFQALYKEVSPPSTWLNSLLTGLLRIDNASLAALDPLFGGSVVAVATKSSD